MKSTDLLVTGGLGLVVLGLAAQLPQIQSATNVSQYYSPRTIPLAFIGTTVALFVFLMVRDGIAAMRLGSEPQRPGDAAADTTGPLGGRRLLFLVASVVYVLLFQPLGFVLSSIFFMAITATLLGARTVRSAAICVALALVVTGLVYLIVVYGLESFLPESPLSF